MTTAHQKAPASCPAFATDAWASLATDTGDATPMFDPSTLDGLPLPARRYLAGALPDGVALSSTVVLGMEGEIRLGGRWLPFAADQILRAGVGLVWAPVVGGRLLRFTGADVLTPRDARMEFRLHGRIPVANATGHDVRRSAQGRLATETVAWLPQALTPQRGARWRAVDDERAIVTVTAAGADIDIDVEVAINEQGQLRSLGLQRWNDSAKPPALAPFGGSVDATHTTPNGVRIAGAGTVGWDWGTAGQRDGEFFRYRITAATYDAPSREGSP